MYAGYFEQVNMDLLRKLNYLLPQIFKKDVAYLAILLLIGVFFEMMGLGILFPVMKLLLSKNIFVEFPMLKTILFWIDNPNQTEIIFLSVFFLIGIYLLKSVYLFYLTSI